MAVHGVDGQRQHTDRAELTNELNSLMNSCSGCYWLCDPGQVVYPQLHNESIF